MSSSNPESSPSAAASATTSSSAWKLPVGIEDHLENGVYMTMAGVAAGGLVGMLLFRSGQGWRSASIASGVGMAVGSTLTRLYGSSGDGSAILPNATSPSATSPASNASRSNSVRVQKFQTEPPKGQP